MHYHKILNTTLPYPNVEYTQYRKESGLYAIAYLIDFRVQRSQYAPEIFTFALVECDKTNSLLLCDLTVINHLGCKWTMFISILGYTTYSLGNFYPSWGTLVPTSIIVGLSGAPLWSAKSAYLTTAAKRYLEDVILKY